MTLLEKIEGLCPQDNEALRNVLPACASLDEVEMVVDRALEREGRRQALREAAIARLAETAYRRYN
ncbi:MAG TPA: hypothetical protein VGK33_16135 [Chloroflexota bacterium]|jgi:hypothetical protein